MTQPEKPETKEEGKRRRRRTLTPQAKIELLTLLVRTVVAGVVGIMLASLFVYVVRSVVSTALLADPTNAAQLLSTVLALVGSAFGAFLGFLFGKAKK